MKELRRLVKKYDKIIQNFSYLTVLQVFNIFFPIIIYPFLINLLGLDLWGKIILAQSLSLYFSLFIDFGFDRYATKEVSIYRNDGDKLSEIVSCIVLLRICLGIIVFALYLMIVYGLPFFKGDEMLYIIFFGTNFNFILFPKWFFQGIEQMKYIVIINVSIKIFFVLLMFLLIDSQGDFLYVPFFFSLGAFVGGIIGLAIMLRFNNVDFAFYKVSTYYKYLKKSFLLFASSIVISIKDRFNVFIVGYFLGMQEVALYDVSIKLISIITQPVESINGAIFPRVSKELDMGFVKKVAMFTLLLVFLLVMGAQIFLYDIFSFLNINEVQHISSIRLVLISSLFLTLSVFLARNCFIVHERFMLLLRTMIWSSVFYVCLIAILFILGEITFKNIVIVVFLVYLFEFVNRYYLAERNNLLSMKISRENIGRYYYGQGKFGVLLKPFMFFYDIYRHRIMDEKTFIKNRFKRRMGYDLDLENPKTLNEKIQWMKLYDRTPLHTVCADKIAVREYVREKIGEEHLVPLLMTTKDVKDLAYDKLPESPFIIKTNHDSGSYRIVRDKKEIKDWDALRTFFAKSLRTNFYVTSKEWQYKNIPPQILVESLLQTEKGEIPEDIKIHCFHGRPEFIQLDFDRGTEKHSRNWYDKDWNRTEFHWALKLKSGKETLPNDMDIPKPRTLDVMLRFAEVLSEPFAYVRVDFYSVEDKVYFGEITFHHDSGFRPIVPKEWDYKLGEMLELPK